MFIIQSVFSGCSFSFFKDVFLSKFLFDEKKVYVYPLGGIDRTVFKKNAIEKKT